MNIPITPPTPTRLTYGRSITALRNSCGRQAKVNHLYLAEAMLASYIRDTGDQLDPTSVVRWDADVRPVPIRIVDYYSTPAGAQKLSSDIRDSVLPEVITPEALADDLTALVEGDPSIHPRVAQRLLRYHPDREDGDLAAMLAEIVRYAMQR